ncbi:MAG TPA: 16S rRNA (cytosine(1402)-N(4))-methyltransferase RsmH, partial [Alphaproteobacteria bacterium]|nr:16S rRNA (cytosine(1402)-N(4))-methyltransferase RsmH [Alphaproteobacteria bacterium]
MSNHYPVMLNEVLENLSPKDGEVYVDGTFGAGGYTKAFLQSADCTVIAIDRDPNAVAAAEELQKDFGDRFIFVRGCFGDALELVKAAGFNQIDGFVLDIGVSSMQIDQPERGFSFRFDGPLDMRMDTKNGSTAADIVNDTEEEALANIIYQYGEERLSRRIAKRIVEKRS